ncbi:uncharacterized protein LOC34623919 [Cyclospora cayetanensis]|uniref:Uncharacterized protein LOC34623919 n=1 Tax=Cyclospora cayetanensis TaxID=88456 RepID=A0A6P6RTM5_9EIME|nr:uncharacterized protein LOC34623919 [Cyclospora cayetanensis]
MGLFSCLKGKNKRRSKQKPSDRSEERPPTEEGDDVIVLYPLYDPRRLVAKGEEPRLLDQTERNGGGLSEPGNGLKGHSLSKQLTEIPIEMRSGEGVLVPHSETDQMEDELLEDQDIADASSDSPLEIPRGDESPLSASSMENALAALGAPFKSPAPPSARRRQDTTASRLPPPDETPPAAPPRQIPPVHGKEEQTPCPATAQPTRAESSPPPPETPAAVLPSQAQPSVAPPPSASPPVGTPREPLSSPTYSRASSSRNSSRSSSSSRSSRRKGRKVYDIETVPTAPTTPRNMRVLECSKQPRLLLLQPHIQPHPATIRMQREGRRTKLRCKQLQLAIDMYAARGGIDLFKVPSHDTENCEPCRFSDFTDTPLLW